MAEKYSGLFVVMEDTVVARMYIVESLKKSGYKVLEAREGHAVLIHAEHYRDMIDVYVLDLKVAEGLGGIDTLRTLRSNDPQIKAIALTDDISVLAGGYKQYGFDSAVEKGDLDLMHHEIINLLKNGK